MNAEWGSIRLERTFTAYDFGVDTYDFPGDIPTFPSWGFGDFWTIYYAADDSILINLDGNYNLKYSTRYGVNWTTNGFGYGWDNRYADTSLGYLPLTGGGYIQMILDGEKLFLDVDLATSKVTQSPVSVYDLTRENAWPLRSIHSNSYGNFVVYIGWPSGELWIVYLMRQHDNKAAVADIIRDICHRVGMTDDMLDLSLVDQTTDGYCIQEMKSAGAAIADLLHVYQIDMVESTTR
jgi:hypothetical protein